MYEVLYVRATQFVFMRVLTFVKHSYVSENNIRICYLIRDVRRLKIRLYQQYYLLVIGRYANNDMKNEVE